MRYRTDKNTGVSAYMQLYTQIKKDIVDGAYHYGARLPSKRLASEEAGVSVITVEHAYRLLCDEAVMEEIDRQLCLRNKTMARLATIGYRRLAFAR